MITKKTKVFKKTSPNGKLTTYLGRKDYYDHKNWQENIDGVCVVDPVYMKNRKVFGLVIVAFRYGDERLNVMGMTFQKDFAIKQMQIYPALEENKHSLTKLQARLINNLGENAVPFHFDLPINTPDTVYIQPSEYDGGAPCGVDYQVTTYVAQRMDDSIHRRNSVSLSIRKLTYFEHAQEIQPRLEISKEFNFTSGTMKMECTLDKARYYSGETMNVSVCVDNTTAKRAKRIKVQVLQIADICLYETITYKSVVTEVESEEGFPIEPNTTDFCGVYKLKPVLDLTKRRAGLALNGRIKYQDTILAASTEQLGNVQKENLGVVISYKVRVKMTLGFGSGDMMLEVPFQLSPPRLKGDFAEPEPVDDGDDQVYYDFIMEEFRRAAVKGFDEEVIGELTKYAL